MKKCGSGAESLIARRVPVKKRLSETILFSPEQCILVFDDLSLPVGSIRSRLNGGAGGHRGVSSIIDAFQSDAFRRVKVGVGKAEATRNRVGYLLTPFSKSDRAAIDRAITEAGVRALKLAANQSR